MKDLIVIKWINGVNMRLVRWKDMDVDTKFFVIRLALGLLLMNQIILLLLILLGLV